MLFFSKILRQYPSSIIVFCSLSCIKKLTYYQALGDEHDKGKWTKNFATKLVGNVNKDS